MSDRPIISSGAIIGVAVALVLIIGGGMTGCPAYNVYSARMSGEAELAQATQNRQIIVQQAEAEQEAEVTRAKGTAAANKIIGDSLRNNPDYLRWLWVNKLDANNNKTVIYVPTDGMVPNLEMGRIGSDHGTDLPPLATKK